LDFYNYVYNGSYQNNVSILSKIPNFGGVTSVPLDYMHLICLGVVKKMINLWIAGPLTVRIPARDVKLISDALILFQNYTPNDFNRKPRSLFDYKHWKATEFRTFLLYTGSVVLKKILRHDIYENFIVLHVAISILINTNLVKDENFINYAKKLLIQFILQFQEIYGIDNVSHNIHNLLHLTDDVKKYGALDEFSAFRFENYMSSLKKMLRKSETPLQQLVKRFSELDYNNSVILKNSNTNLCLKKNHTNGPLTADLCKNNVLQFKQFWTSNMSIICDNKKNCFCLLKNNMVVSIQNIIQIIESHEIFIVGFILKPEFPYNLYTSPCISNNLDINIVANISKSQNLHYWPITNIKTKLWRLPMKDKFVVIPLVHTH
ncbi:Uncharacterized protein FWK35_00038081, partial [Aphis craccivora]